MPNWCNCSLEVIGSKSDIARFANDFYDLKEKDFSMKKMMQMPKELEADYSPIKKFNLKEEYEKETDLFKNVIRVNDIVNVEENKDFVIVGTLKKREGSHVTIDSWGEELKFQMDKDTKKETYFINNSLMVVVFTYKNYDLKCKAIVGNSSLEPNLYVPILNGTYAYLNDIYDTADDKFDELNKRIKEDVEYVRSLIEETRNDTFRAYVPLILKDEKLSIPFDVSVIGKIAANTTAIRGYNSWYDWSIENYGTKWDISPGFSLEDFINYSGMCYQTAWGPNEAFYFNVSRRYPDLTFKLVYDEEGVGFAGECEIKNGIYLSNEYYDSSIDALEYYKKLVEINGDDFIESLLFEYELEEDLIIQLCDACDAPEDLKNEAIEECRHRAS